MKLTQLSPFKRSTRPAAAAAAGIPTPALAELAAKQQHIVGLLAEDKSLLARIADFNAGAAIAQPAALRLGELKEHRNSLLGAVALGEADASAIDAVDRELQAAEAEARGADRAREIAEAGAARLTALHAALQPQIKAAPAGIDALSYAAGLELVRLKLPAYRAALMALGQAHAELLGACQAADTFSSTQSDPRRMPVAGPLRVKQFSALLPLLEGLNEKEWTFSLEAEAGAAAGAALTQLRGVLPAENFGPSGG